MRARGLRVVSWAEIFEGRALLPLLALAKVLIHVVANQLNAHVLEPRRLQALVRAVRHACFPSFLSPPCAPLFFTSTPSPSSPHHPSSLLPLHLPPSWHLQHSPSSDVSFPNCCPRSGIGAAAEPVSLESSIESFLQIPSSWRAKFTHVSNGFESHDHTRPFQSALFLGLEEQDRCL